MRREGPRAENFPVASLVLARPLRGPVLAFYRFVRAADDIADAPRPAPARRSWPARRAGGGAGRRRPRRARGRCPGRGRPRARRRRRAEARLLLDGLPPGRGQAALRRLGGASRLLPPLGRPGGPLPAAAARRARPRRGARRRALHRAADPQPPPGPRRPTASALDRIYLPRALAGAGRRRGGVLRARERAARRPVLDAALDRVDAAGRDGRACCRRGCGAAASRCRPRRRSPAPSCWPAAARGTTRSRRGSRCGRATSPAQWPAAPVSLRRATRADAALCTRRSSRRSGSSFRLGMALLAGAPPRHPRGLCLLPRRRRAADGAAPAAERLRFLDALARGADGSAARRGRPIGRELAWALPRFDLPAPSSTCSSTA